jgi:FxsC-like protein
MADLPLWFFLSYAHANDNDAGLVKTFYEQLSGWIAQRVGQPAASVGFLDKYELHQGVDWGDDLKAALSRCRTFVPLMSPDYWKSRWAGAEWAFFEQRCANTGTTAIAPIQWVAPFEGTHPEFARRLQYAPSLRGLAPEVQAQFERNYRDKGLLALVQRRELPAYADVYLSAVEHIGEEILRLAQLTKLAAYAGAPLPSLADMPNRFAPESPAAHGGNGEASRRRRAHFAVVAGRADEMQALRPENAARYSAQDDDWVPFALGNESIALISQQVASELGLVHTSLPAAPRWLEQVREAERNHHPSVVLIDPWSAQLPRHRARLEELDAVMLGNCVVLVVWDLASDAEQKKRDALLANVDHLLWRRRSQARAPYLCEDVADPVRLRAGIRSALNELEALLATRRAVVRPVEKGLYAQRPGISASAGVT